MFLPFDEQKRKRYYVILRSAHLILTAASIPLALVYLKHYNERVVDGMGLEFLAILCCMVVMLKSEQYFFPLELKEAWSVTLSLVATILVGLFVTEDRILYGSYQLFYTVIWMQAILGLGFMLSLLVTHFRPLPFYIDTKNSFLMTLGMSGAMFLILSPVIAGPYTLGDPFFHELNQLEGYKKWTIISALGWNVGYNVFRVSKLLFVSTSQREEMKQRMKEYEGWEGAANMLFFIILMVIFGLSFF